MTFAAFETAQETGRPAELFDFRIGLETHRFTSWANQVVLPIGTFNPEPVSRTRITQETNNREGDLDVTIPSDNDFVEAYESTAIPGGRSTLTLYRVHLNDPDLETVVFFRGNVTNISRSADGREAIIHVNSFLKSQSRQIPRRTYQGSCNHSLYDSLCTISDQNPSFEKFLTCSAISASGLVLTISGAGSFGSDFFEAGFIQFAADFRFVVDQGGAGDNDLTIRVPFTTSPVGQTVRVLAGCKHRVNTDCDTKFANRDNFGGFPFVPLKNPFSSGLD